MEPHSGDWISTPPITSIGLRMTNETIRLSTGIRLGVKICEPHTCICDKMVDCLGLHGLSCRKSAGRSQRHNSINDIIWRACRRAKIQATKEPLGLLREDGKRPDGVTLIPWKGGKCLAWDATVPDTFAPSHVTDTATTAGTAAKKAADAKILKYIFISQTHLFVPVAIETAGCWDARASEFIMKLGRRITEVTGEQQESKYLFQQISVAVQRGNMLAIEGTYPPDK